MLPVGGVSSKELLILSGLQVVLILIVYSYSVLATLETKFHCYSTKVGLQA